MTQLAFSTNAFKKHALEEAIEQIAGIGYAGVELMADVPHAYPPDMDGPRRRRVTELLSRLGLAVSNINAFTLFARGDTYHPTWIEDDPVTRQMRIDHTVACIELAAEFGAKTISLQPGGPMISFGVQASACPSDTQKRERQTRQLAGQRFAEGLLQVLPAALKHDVTLAIEPEPGLFIQSSQEYLDFKNEFFEDEPRVAMNCDVGHLYCVGEDPAEAIRRLREHVVHVHLEDIGANRVHQHLTPGKGAIDFTSIFAALDDIAYQGWVTVELYPYETTAAGVARAAWEHLRAML